MRVQIDYVRAKAYKDGLTGLENRTAYLEYVQELDELIQNDENCGFTVAMFDLNGLKEINDGQGHDKGDETIIRAAGILTGSFPDARIFRIGGDEFVVIIEDPCIDIRKLITDYEELAAEAEPKDSSRCIMSNGYAKFDRSQDKVFEDTFKRADSLMYENKKAYYATRGNRRSR